MRDAIAAKHQMLNFMNSLRVWDLLRIHIGFYGVTINGTLYSQVVLVCVVLLRWYEFVAAVFAGLCYIFWYSQITSV